MLIDVSTIAAFCGLFFFFFLTFTGQARQVALKLKPWPQIELPVWMKPAGKLAGLLLLKKDNQRGGL